MHSIVVGKYKHPSISGRSPTGGMKKIISFCTLINVFGKNSFDFLLIYFVFYMCNSLEKQAENGGVILNRMNCYLLSYTQFQFIVYQKDL